MIGSMLVLPKQICLCVLSLASFVMLALDAQALESEKNVLVIHSYHSNFLWTQQEKEGIDLGFQKSAHDVVVYHEFLDAKRYPELRHRFAFFDAFALKYEEIDLDVVMISDDPAMNFYLSARDEYFSDVPVVFMGINQVQEDLLNVPWLTGAFENHDLSETIIEANRATETDSVIIISDSSETGLANFQKIETFRSSPNAPSTFVYLTDLVSDDSANALALYPAHWPVVIAGQLRNGSPDGPLISYRQVGASNGWGRR